MGRGKEARPQDHMEVRSSPGGQGSRLAISQEAKKFIFLRREESKIFWPSEIIRFGRVGTVVVQGVKEVAQLTAWCPMGQGESQATAQHQWVLFRTTRLSQKEIKHESQ